MENSQKKQGFFYGWVIVLAGTLIMASVMGIIYNCFSQFIKPVCEELGFSRRAMSMNQTIVSLVQVLIAFGWGWILKNVNIKRLMLLISVVGPVGFFCYSFCSKIWMFYGISVLMSCTLTLLSVLPFSYIISNWFVEKRGLATGICFMGSGLGGMILNPMLGVWLQSYGWRMSFRILAVIMGVVAIPCVLLVKIRPGEKGLKALGADRASGSSEGDEDGITLAEAKKMPKFWILACCSMGVNMGLSSLVQTLSPHLTDNSYSVTFAAAMVSVSMGAMALGKILLGQLFDMLGTRRATKFSLTCAFLGLMGMLFCKVTPLLGLIVLGIGFGCAFGTVGNPIVVQNVFGKRDFAAIMGLYTAFCNIGSAIAPTANGAVFDFFGSYRPAYVVLAAVVAVSFICFSVYLPKGDKKAAKAK